MRKKRYYALFAVLGAMLAAEWLRPAPKFSIFDLSAVAEARLNRFNEKLARLAGSCGNLDAARAKEASEVARRLCGSSTDFESDFSFDAGERVFVNLLWRAGDCEGGGCARQYARLRRGNDEAVVENFIEFNCASREGACFRTSFPLYDTALSDVGLYADVEIPSGDGRAAIFRLITDERGSVRDIPFIWRTVTPNRRGLANDREGESRRESNERPLTADGEYIRLDGGNPRRALVLSPFDWLMKRWATGRAELNARLHREFFGRAGGAANAIDDRRSPSSLAKSAPLWTAEAEYAVDGAVSRLRLHVNFKHFPQLLATVEHEGRRFPALYAEDALERNSSRDGRIFRSLPLAQLGRREFGAYAFIQLPSLEKSDGRLFVYADENSDRVIEVPFEWKRSSSEFDREADEAALRLQHEDELRILSLGFSPER